MERGQADCDCEKRVATMRTVMVVFVSVAEEAIGLVVVDGMWATLAASA